MAKGTCTNITNCTKASNQEIQEVDASNFVCKECGKPLVPTDATMIDDENKGGGGIDKKKLFIIIGCGLAVCVVGFVFWLLFGRNAGGCGRGPQPPTGISLVQKEISIAEGGTETLQVQLEPADAKAELRWASKNPKIATVENGVVTGVAEGVTQVGVQVVDDKELKDLCTVTVTQGVTYSISISGDKTIKPGNTSKLKATVIPADETKKLIWNSNNPSIATVSADGTVTGISEGTADITAQLEGTAATSSYTITVSKGTGIHLDYGTYTGETKNGKPHGKGTLVFTKNHVLSPYDMDKITAEPGESYQGQFVNGFPTIGALFNADGTRKRAVNLGAVNN